MRCHIDTREAVMVANGCTMGTYAYTSTTEREMRLLHSSEAYLKWSHLRKATILEGHQRALRTNTQLLFVCFVVAVAMLLGGPVGVGSGSSWWGLGGGGDMLTLNNLHLTHKVVSSSRRTSTAMPPMITKYCTVPIGTGNITTRTTPTFIQRVHSSVLEMGCNVADYITHQDGIELVKSPSFVFMGVFAYVLGFTLLLLPILHRFRLLQDRALEIRDRVHDVAITSSVTSTGVVTSLFEESPTILSPAVPLLLPTAKSLLSSSTTTQVGFTNERELLDEYERNLLIGGDRRSYTSITREGLRPAAIGLMVAGLLLVEAHICVLRAGGTTGGIDATAILTSSAMRSVTEWVVFAVTIKAIALVQTQ